MRQSRKEAKIERMAREGMNPERREAMAFPESPGTEFAEEWGNGPAAGTRNGRRQPPGGRG
ncbi:hypothetical protein GE107_03090 [Cohnella sp. CFH 77786]|uniref:hypothetical protein n=1 Tax=Cohnella sp. CFH 77786 TaxID=2662265 RepID=UPI001C60D5A9|nr:hypothetical protein [Cohnella sp. CFH 77786]MBW5445049.1 hypothetical protein [Cohnella sp. CFH 77786]